MKMPFSKININTIIDEKVQKEPEFAKAYSIIEEEYKLIEEAIKLRNELGVTQTQIACETGLTQQMVSRTEKLGNSPTLRNFLQYINGMGLEIKLEKKH